MEEIWKDIIGYEGKYQVSNLGRVKGLDKIDGKGRKVKGRILKPNPSGHNRDYLQVGLCKDGVKKRHFIHRLVAEHFIDNPNNLPQVNHKDENKSNNNVDNLEWCDAKYNVNYGTRNSRAGKKIQKTNSQKIKGVNIETGEILIFNSSMEAEREMGFSHSAISECCNKNLPKRQSHKGYIWEKIED